jgi:branched-chain amino acid transport system permease protein
MAVETRPVRPEAPVDIGVELLPARPVDLRRAVRLGLIAGLTTVFVSAIGMVEQFSERELIQDLSLGTCLLLVIPLLFGALAGQPPARIQGFAAARPGWRNPVAGLIAGALLGGVMTGFVLLIVNHDVRDTFINITPALAEAEDGPRLLLYGRSLGPGIGLILGLDMLLATLGGAVFLLGPRWRRAVLAGALTVVAFALLQPFIQQVLRGTRAELRVETNQLNRFLYSGSALRLGAAVAVAVIGFLIHVQLNRPGRQALQTRAERLSVGPRRLVHVVAALAVLAVVLILPQVLGSFLAEVLSLAGIFVMMGLGLNIVVGYAGLLDLGYVAFFAVGAYTTAVLTSSTGGLEWAWVFWAAIPFVLLTSAAAGIVVGTPVLRMRGDYLAIVTLGFGEIARLLFLSDWLTPTFGGAQGIIRIPNITIGPIEIKDSQGFLYAVFVLILLAAYVSYALQNSRVGRAWMAMREDESVAEAVGVNIVVAKLSAFVIGAILAGLGGALFATKLGSIFPHSFDIIVSITVLVIVIVGGMASVPGVMLGAVVLVGLPEMLREFEEYRFLIYGALLIFMMLRRPEGLIPSTRRAQELHEEDVEQDVWLRSQVEENGPLPADPGGAG